MSNRLLILRRICFPSVGKKTREERERERERERKAAVELEIPH